VAAVCYRVREDGIEFLLVQTRGGRWTFPKGGVEPGLTHAQAAALEAFEEAGVHGRMEEASFSRYIHRKRGELAVNAHLCEVLRLGPPQESKRNRTWFPAEKAKRRLRDDRAPDCGAELARVVDRAVTRIEQLQSRIPEATSRTGHIVQEDALRKDALQRVQFEAIAPLAVHSRVVAASFTRYVRRPHRDLESSDEPELAVNARLSQALPPEMLRAKLLRNNVLRLGPAPAFNRAVTRIRSLSNGTSAVGDAPERTPFAIDDARGTTGRVKASIGKRRRRNISPVD
jgi:8-oxo-dGTP pyrophosphatase MutT (NUDIX family)